MLIHVWRDNQNEFIAGLKDSLNHMHAMAMPRVLDISSPNMEGRDIERYLSSVL